MLEEEYEKKYMNKLGCVEIYMKKKIYNEHTISWLILSFHLREEKRVSYIPKYLRLNSGSCKPVKRTEFKIIPTATETITRTMECCKKPLVTRNTPAETSPP